MRFHCIPFKAVEAPEIYLSRIWANSHFLLIHTSTTGDKKPFTRSGTWLSRSILIYYNISRDSQVPDLVKCFLPPNIPRLGLNALKE